MVPVDIKIYTQNITPRLEYVARVVLGDIMGVEFEVISDKRRIGTTPLINYSGESVTGSFNIAPSGLLSEEGIREVTPVTVWIESMPLLFPSEGVGDLPFDIFSAAFYMLSRYEEYLPFTPDRHGRFPVSPSLACREGFHQMPVVDLWIRELTLALIKHFPFMTFRRNEFTAVTTFDIDEAYAYRGKGVLRGAAGFVGDIFRGGRPSERVRSVTGGSDDPYDVYDYLFSRLEENGSDALFFLPFGSWSAYDKNSRPSGKVWKELVGRITDRYPVGIHLSYSSADDEGLAVKEVRRFIQTAGAVPLSSRQHYLRLRFPTTYRTLIANGVGADYTMGFAAETGYRAGIARPYRFYDLQREEFTLLVIYPFQVMDVTLKDYLKCDPDSAATHISALLRSASDVGGTFISVWHNTSLTESNGWEGWRTVFEKMLTEQQNGDQTDRK